MNRVITKLLTKTSSREINGVEVEEKTSLVRFMKIPLVDTIKNLLTISRVQKAKTVFYPGISTDILFPIITTDCDLLIGVDLVDPSFFPILKCSEPNKLDPVFQNKIEAYYILDTLSKNLNLLSEIDSRFPDVPFSNISTVPYKDGIRLSIKFEFLKRMRTIIIYIGYDANTFIPKELYGNFLLYQSAFTLDEKVIQKLKPAYILAPIGETGVDCKLAKSSQKSVILPLLDKIDVDDFLLDLEGENVVIKAYILSKLLFPITYELCSFAPSKV